MNALIGFGAGLIVGGLVWKKSEQQALAAYGLDYNANLTPENAFGPGGNITWGEPVITSRTDSAGNTVSANPPNLTLVAGIGLLAAAAWAAL